VKVRHPLVNQLFEQQPDGLVKVEDLDTGEVGWFQRKGRWVRGDLTYADPQLLDWVGGRPLPNHDAEDNDSLETMGYH
jgi:hypothetical protein